ncbi:hypothetical protein AB1Y20_005696 [Prymnesium parvum]|uniref:DNA helicase n=1 Tax=Prymnesium parvum TaxID=97485 RepID=A0AB34J0H7_PRYPA
MVLSLPHRTRIPAASRSRFLRDAARAAEALVLTAWFAASDARSWPPPRLPPSLGARLGADSAPSALLASLRAHAGLVLRADGSLGAPLVGGERREVLSALSLGVEQAAESLEALHALQELLRLERPAARVETYDISHLHGTHTVGARAVLSRGAAHLEEYACRRVRRAAPADDPAAMRETLRALTGRPDVLLVDGGKGQLRAAYEVAAELGMEESGVLALAKKEEDLYTLSGRVRLPHGAPLRLLQRQRDEAHASALLAHRSARHAAQFHSALDGAPLDAAASARLHAAFGSAAALRSATAGALGRALGCGALGEAVHAHLRQARVVEAVELAPRLEGHDSAVSALAHTSRRAGPAVDEWMREEAARRWWGARQAAASGVREEAVERVLEAAAAALQRQGGARELEAAIAACRRAPRPPRAAREAAAAASAAVAVEEEEEEEEEEGAAGRARVEAAAGTFRLVAPYVASAEQAAASAAVSRELSAGRPRVVLKGATGTGKTFVMARLIEETNRPTLIVAPNKVLAAQICTELKGFFPHNSVNFFISHFDFYQPETYMPTPQLYKPASSSKSDAIDKLRHEATRSLFERRDTVVVATVSCIFGLGLPSDYLDNAFALMVGQSWKPDVLSQQLEAIQYVHARDGAKLKRGDFGWQEGADGAEAEGRGVRLTLQPAHEERQLHVALAPLDEEGEHTIEAIWLEGEDRAAESLSSTVVYPASHHVFVDEARMHAAIAAIEAECKERTAQLRAEWKHREADRLESRVRSDLRQIKEKGWCLGMENYVRHMSGRAAGEPPTTLLDYMPEEWLLLVDESHITVPLLGAMHEGVRKRKRNLVSHGFRLPSAMDNRPLTAAEVWERVPQAVLVSATPGREAALCGEQPHAELLLRPTGVVDPQVEVVDCSRAGGYEDHLLSQIARRQAAGSRTLVSCLTKRSAEALAVFLEERGVKAGWIHSGVTSTERLEALDKLRSGEIDVLVGCNMLREGLDLPEVSLVAILGAEKQGFLRSASSLIQTIGRAARHIDGTCLMYTDDGRASPAMIQAIAETERRRNAQLAHNALHNVVPQSPTNAASARGGVSKGAALLELMKGPRGRNSTPRTKPEDDLEGGELELYGQIRAWRSALASAEERRPYMVVSEAVMRAIARAKPTTKEELRDVKGIGPKKVAAYAEGLLGVVRDHLEQKARLEKTSDDSPS